MQTIVANPTTYTEVVSLPNHIRSFNHASALVRVRELLPNENDGPVTSKKLFLDKAKNALVYEFYRIKAKDEKIFVIF